MPDSELPHQKHNRLAYEIAEKILEAYPQNLERLILIETLVAANLELMTKHLPKHNQKSASLKLFEALIPGIKIRLNEIKED